MWRLILAMLGASAGGESDLRPDEVIVFFPTCAHFDETNGHWIIPIHGWVHEPELDSIRRAAALGLLRRGLGLDKEDENTPIFQERVRAFITSARARGSTTGRCPSSSRRRAFPPARCT